LKKMDLKRVERRRKCMFTHICNLACGGCRCVCVWKIGEGRAVRVVKGWKGGRVRAGGWEGRKQEGRKEGGRMDGWMGGWVDGRMDGWMIGKKTMAVGARGVTEADGYVAAWGFGLREGDEERVSPLLQLPTGSHTLDPNSKLPSGQTRAKERENCQ
jgi:hypothetical protein